MNKLSIEEHARRIAQRLDPSLREWVDEEDIAQEIRLASIEEKKHYSHVVQSVERDYRSLAQSNTVVEVQGQDSRLRPTETEVIRNMFWRSLFEVLKLPTNPSGVPPNPLRRMRLLVQKYIGSYTNEEIGDIDDVTGERVKSILDKTTRQLRHPARAGMLREYTEEDMSE